MKMKSIKIKFVSIVLICIFLVTGCSTLEKVNDSIVTKQDKKNDVIYKSPDKKESISTPSSWSSETELNENAVIQVCNKQQEKYVIVIAQDKDYFSSEMTLSDYTNILKEDIMAKITNATATDIKYDSLNGNNTQYYEVKGEINKLKITYLYMNIEAENKFYQVIGWTLTAKFEENRKDILDVMNTFMINKEL